jgi:hypothetical protein
VGLPGPKVSKALDLNLFYSLKHTIIFLALPSSSVIPSLLGSNQAKKEAM